MWRTIPASAFLRRLVALSAGLLLAVLVAMLSVGPLAHATHAPDCLGKHPTNNPPQGFGQLIEGTPGDDVLAGGPVGDQIYGHGGVDRICGYGGNDRIEGGEGFDRLDGGLGDDRIVGTNWFPRSLGCFSPEDQPAGQKDGGAVIFADDGNNIIMGTGDSDFVRSGTGNDCIMALEGDDTMYAGSGNDEIFAGDGSDRAVGEDGSDLIVGGPAGSGPPQPFEDGNDELFASTVFLDPIPRFPDTCQQSGELAEVNGPADSGQRNDLFGGDGYDLLVGSTTQDFMIGGSRGDDMYGFAGPDVLGGSRASDCLSGGPQEDVLNDADPENTQPDDTDTLWGGAHSDELNARDGDRFDSLKGGGSFTDRCIYDQGDAVFTFPFGDPSLCF